MLYYNTSLPQLEEAARLAGVSLKVGNPSGRGIRVTLALIPDPERRHPAEWQRVSHTRRVNAVCWHGHAAFMLHLYLLNPKVRIKGGRNDAVDYRDAYYFLLRFRFTGRWNIGSLAHPLMYEDACVCAYAQLERITALEGRLEALQGGLDRTGHSR